MTDKQKVLEALQDAGATGIHSFDLIKRCGTYRVAARVNDLRKEGYVIVSVNEKKGNSLGCRYSLHSSPEVKPKPEQYIFRDNVAIPVADPKQLSFL